MRVYGRNLSLFGAHFFKNTREFNAFHILLYNFLTAFSKICPPCSSIRFSGQLSELEDIDIQAFSLPFVPYDSCSCLVKSFAYVGF